MHLHSIPKNAFILPYAELIKKRNLPRFVDRYKLEASPLFSFLLDFSAYLSSQQSHLSDEDFFKVFGCTRDVFYTYKPWRQQQLKKNADLF